ncbi:MAG: RNA polymerase sigma factor [Planctomycetes bacterium]|nr:RNA polymerase sigma factor [Planctomycetota bacterium]
MARSLALQAPPALPKNPWTVRRLAERGVDLPARPGEEPEQHVARLETALMALFRDEGHEQAFQALYELARAPLALWIAGLAGSRLPVQDLEHLVQDTFVNVYRYAQSFRDEQPRSFRVWSRTIASNVLRRARMRRRTLALEDFPTGLQEPSDERADPAESVIQTEEGRSLAAAWMILLLQYAEAARQLAPRDREALDLIEVRGLSYAEASVQLGVRLSNMKMILFRARRRIRATIGGSFQAREEKARRLAG